MSVVIPTRDRPELLRDAIASVRSQTFTDQEIIVVVNGPDNSLTRRTLEVANGAACSVIRIEKPGIGVALNTGITAARGQWLALLDDDDLWAPGKLEIQLKAAEMSDAALVFCDFCHFDEMGCTPAPRVRPPPSIPVREALTTKAYGGGCSMVLIKRDAVLEVGGFDESMDSPDWDLFMRLAWRHPVMWVDEYLVWVRRHRKNTSKQLSWARSVLRVLLKAFKTVPADLQHLRAPILLAMVKTIIKGLESEIRRNYLQPLRDLVLEQHKTNAPIVCPFAKGGPAPSLGAQGRCRNEPALCESVGTSA